MRILVKMARDGALCYISHLDLLRLVQRTLRRAALPVKYSQGFNPHPVLSFAQALGVGLETVGDYFMTELTQEVSPEDLIKRFNEKTPHGVTALAAREMAECEKSPMARVKAAQYRLKTDGSKTGALHGGARKLMDMASCVYTVHDTQKDIRALVYGADCDETGAVLLVSCGNENLPHKTLVKIVCELADLCAEDMSLRREDLYTRNEDGTHVSLFDRITNNTDGR